MTAVAGDWLAGSFGWAMGRLAVGCLLALGMNCSLPGGHAADTHHSADKPSVVIEVGRFGYGRPGDLYITMRYSLVSLDFIDSSHLLFTFEKKGLLRHTPDERPDDEDQLIHAVVVELPSGKELASADWRMHDRQRYLWSVGKGTFLVRQRDNLSLTDSSLDLRPYGRFPGRLVAVEVAAGGTLLVAQTEEPAKSAAPTTSDNGPTELTSTKPNPILIRILRIEDRVVIAKSRAAGPVIVPVNRSGIVEVLEGKPNRWVLNFDSLAKGANATPVKPFAEVSSACAPTLLFLSAETVMAVRCTPSNEKSGMALSLDGKMLWEHKWPSAEHSGTMVSAEDGSRFAHSTLTTRGPALTDMSEISGQQVTVFDTITGKLVLTAPAFPVYDAGGNFALSADGRQFAILHNGSIEVYDLP